MPPAQLAEAALALAADVVGVSISEAADLRLTEAHLRRLESSLPNQIEVWLGGKHARKLNLHNPRIRRVITWLDLEEAVLRLRDLRGES